MKSDNWPGKTVELGFEQISSGTEAGLTRSMTAAVLSLFFWPGN